MSGHGPNRLADCLCLVRGGGDLATGVVWRLSRAGFPVVVTELPEPLTVRRTVSLSSAVADRDVVIEGMRGRLAATAEDALGIAASGAVAVLVSPELPALRPQVVVDARLAKRRLDTVPTDAPLVVALGPGFVAPDDCHAVIETQRGPGLGRVLWQGAALPDTGTPGVIAGRGVERVIRAPLGGRVEWSVSIGDGVREGEEMGQVGGRVVTAPFDGVVRGLIAPGRTVAAGLKIGDVDPRPDVDFRQISDKALAVGGGVLEAVVSWWSRQP